MCKKFRGWKQRFLTLQGRWKSDISKNMYILGISIVVKKKRRNLNKELCQVRVLFANTSLAI